MHHVSTETLHQAIQKGDKHLVQELVNSGADMDEVLGLRGTALCAAISAKQPAIAEYLINAGCDVNAEDYDREPPLLLALRKEIMNVAKQIIFHPRCNLNKIDPLTKIPALCFASMVGLQQAVDWLIKAGSSLNQRDADGNSPLHLAIKNKHYTIIKVLVEQNAPLMLFNVQGCNPVHTAAQIGDVKALQTIFSTWIHVDTSWNKTFKIYKGQREDEDKIRFILNFKTKLRNETALILALREGYNYAVKYLLCLGADPNIGGKSDISPLLLACQMFIGKKIDIETVEWLILAGADLSAANIGWDMMHTPLTFASMNNSLDLVKILVKHCYSVNNTNIGKNLLAPALYVSFLHQSLAVSWYFLRECSDYLDMKETIFYYERNFLHALACTKSFEVKEIADVLVKAGCSINGPEAQHNGETPLHLAVRENNSNVIQVLVEYGACVNRRLTGNGYSPLHICADEGNVEIARLLLESGVDLNMKDASGHTAFEIALDYVGEEYIDLCKFLLRAGSDLPIDLSVDCFHEIEDSDSEDENTSSSNLIPAALDEDEELKLLVLERLRMPKLLQETCLQTVREHFIKNQIKFSNILKLTIPKKCTDKLLYRHC